MHRYPQFIAIYRVVHITFTLFGSITHFGRSLLQANRQSFEDSMDRERQ